MIFPDSDNVFTLQMLSTNTIVISLTPKIWEKKQTKTQNQEDFTISPKQCLVVCWLLNVKKKIFIHCFLLNISLHSRISKRKYKLLVITKITSSYWQITQEEVKQSFLTFNTNAATLIGMHVPGPLQRIYKEKKSETKALSGSSLRITIRRIFKHTG